MLIYTLYDSLTASIGFLIDKTKGLSLNEIINSFF